MQDNHAELSAELKLLLAVSRPDRPIDFDTSELDWDLLRKLAESHGLLPLVWEAVRKHAHCASSFALQHEAEQYGKRQLKLSSALLALTQQFRNENIALLPYKGPTLAQQLYGNLALRQSVDLDILIRPAELRSAKEVLAGMGFRQTLNHSRAQELFLESSHCEAEFYSESADVSVELHWAVLPIEFGVNLPSSATFDEGTRILFCGAELPVATREESILWLAAHATKHCWNRLIFLSDFAHALSAPDLDVDRLMSRARAAHSESMVKFGVSLLQRVLHYVPAQLTPLSMDAPPRRQLEFVTVRLLSGSVVEPSAFERHTLAMSSMDTPARAARYCWNVVRNPQPADFGTTRLPQGLMFLYVPLRFARLAGKGMLSLLPSHSGRQIDASPAKVGCSD
jgi:hypothetical protein